LNSTITADDFDIEQLVSKVADALVSTMQGGPSRVVEHSILDDMAESQDSKMLIEDFVGDFIRFTNLATRSEMNGRLGLIVDYHKDRDRFSVRMLGQERVILVKPINLAVRAGGSSLNPVYHQCPICKVGEAHDIQQDCCYCRATSSSRIAGLRKSLPHCDFLVFQKDIQSDKYFH